MANLRLGKRERQLLQLAKMQGQRQKPIAYSAVNVPNWSRSPNGSVNSADVLKAGTHSNFRGQGAGYGVKVLHTGKASLGRVIEGHGWRKQAPLPDLSRSELLALDRGHKITPAPVTNEYTGSTRATSPAVKRFTKTK